MTAHGLRMTRLNKFTKVQSYLHESIPIAKESVPTHIETQAQGFMKDKAVIFQGDATILQHLVRLSRACHVIMAVQPL